jgi:S-formylglutathione hydrolase FrmB
MRALHLRLVGCALLVLLAACGGAAGDVALESECFLAPSGATARQICAVLPPSYASSPERRYAVIYFLHGFGESPAQVRNWTSAIAAAMGGGQEAIVVALQGGSSFYVGQAEAWVVSEAVAAVDARYRTLATRTSRGLSGFSMGGFGAMNLSLRHPDVFGAAFAFAGGFLRPGDLPAAMASWTGDSAFLGAYANAFAGGQIPSMTGSPADLAVQALWYAGFGDWDDKLGAYATTADRLSAVRIEWGTSDGYTWIPRGSQALVSRMTAAGLPISSESHAQGHSLTMGVVQSCLIPFFLAHLELAPQT